MVLKQTASRCIAPAPRLPEVGPLPNLGYFLTAALTVPVWDWGTLRSKLHQAEYKQESAKAALSQGQRLAISELYATYDEAMVAHAALDEAKHTADLATESLRLTTLRYQGGAALASEVVDPRPLWLPRKMRMPTRKFATALFWQRFKHLQEVSDGPKTQRQANEWERINVFPL